MSVETLVIRGKDAATVIIGGLIILYAVWHWCAEHRGPLKPEKNVQCGCGGCASGCQEPPQWEARKMGQGNNCERLCVLSVRYEDYGVLCV